MIIKMSLVRFPAMFSECLIVFPFNFQEDKLWPKGKPLFNQLVRNILNHFLVITELV